MLIHIKVSLNNFFWSEIFCILYDKSTFKATSMSYLNNMCLRSNKHLWWIIHQWVGRGIESRYWIRPQAALASFNAVTVQKIISTLLCFLSNNLWCFDTKLSRSSIGITLPQNNMCVWKIRVISEWVLLLTPVYVYVPVCLIRLGRGIERFDRPALGGFLARQSFAHLLLVSSHCVFSHICKNRCRTM